MQGFKQISYEEAQDVDGGCDQCMSNPLVGLVYGISGLITGKGHDYMSGSSSGSSSSSGSNPIKRDGKGKVIGL